MAQSFSVNRIVLCALRPDENQLFRLTLYGPFIPGIPRQPRAARIPLGSQFLG